MINDVKVIISASQPTGQAGSWYPLVYVKGSEGTATYKEYYSLAEVLPDFAETTDAYKVASLIFGQGEEYSPNKIAIVKGGDTVMTSLTDYMDKDWRQLIIAGEDYDSAVATAIEATEKMYFTHFKSVTELTTAKITTYDRTVAIVYSGEDVTNPEAALVGRMAGYAAGAATYHAKVVKGVTADVLTDAEVKAIHDAGGIAYVLKNGRVATSNGICGSGEWIDVIDSYDWLIQNIRYDVQEVFLNNDKIAYTDAGIAKIESAVRNRLMIGYNNGMIATNEEGLPSFSTNFPLRSQTTETDRISREYNYGTFAADLAGAIHKANPIKGTITA